VENSKVIGYVNQPFTQVKRQIVLHDRQTEVVFPG